MVEIKTINAEELKKKIENNPELIIINILSRADYDYEDCHIKNSINISFEILEEKVKSWQKNKEIVVYCSDYDCNLSENIFEFLAKKGFKNVWGYDEGMSEWHKKCYPVESSCGLKCSKG